MNVKVVYMWGRKSVKHTFGALRWAENWQHTMIDADMCGCEVDRLIDMVAFLGGIHEQRKNATTAKHLATMNAAAREMRRHIRVLRERGRAHTSTLGHRGREVVVGK